jgi:transposase
MTAKRTVMERVLELLRLHRMGTKPRVVARLLKMSPNTEREYRTILEGEGLLRGSITELPSLEEIKAVIEKGKPRPTLPRQQRSGIEAWAEKIEALFSRGVKPRAIFERLRTEEAFEGSYPQVKRLCKTLNRAQGVRARDVAIPVLTLPGEVAQVDFGHVGRLFDPGTVTLREAYCFVMVLGFSRKMVVRVVFDQRVETWQWLHAQAFEELGGVPETVVPDNLKAAVIRAAFSVSGPSTVLNRSYRELARHYSFKIDPTPPYDPAKKGKVEAGVKYVKRSFFAGRDPEDIQIVAKALSLWVREVANDRVHGTTGKKPSELFEKEERMALGSLPVRPYEPVVWKKAKVHPDSHVVFDRRLYSVPWRLVGQEVWIQATASTVCIFAEDVRVATHSRRNPSPRSTQDAHLPEHRRDLRERSWEYWVKRAAKMGDEVESYIIEVFCSDDVLSQLRTVQAIVTHLERYPPERAQAACRRAHFYGNYNYNSIKNILIQALDREQLPSKTVLNNEDEPPTFARNISEMLSEPLEVIDESC